MIRNALVAFFAFAALDGVWLGLVMNRFYRDRLAAIARLENGAFAPVWPAAILVYVLLAAGIAALVVPRATSVWSAAGYGAVLGLVVYGVYDLTNYATLAQYPLPLAVVDIAWGVLACAVCAAVVRAVS